MLWITSSSFMEGPDACQLKGLLLLPCYTQGSLLRDRGTGACGMSNRRGEEICLI